MVKTICVRFMGVGFQATEAMNPPDRNRQPVFSFVLRWMAERIHWLALDSVAVLLAYQEAMLHLGGVRLPAGVAWLLGGGVWAGYTADRMLDVSREPGRVERSPRHHFHQRHLVPLSAIWMTVVGMLVVVGFRMLPRSALLAGLAVATGAAAYVWFFGRPAADPKLWRWPKRLGTVLLLSLGGIWWVAWYPPRGVPWLAGIGFFAAGAWGSLLLLHHYTVHSVKTVKGQLLVAGTICLGAAAALGSIGSGFAVFCLFVGYVLVARWARHSGTATEETLGGALDAVLGLSLLCLTLPW
jgi:hypothetical protein